MERNLLDFSLTLWGEASGEPIESQMGVGAVIVNRTTVQFHGATTYSDVCHAPAQFSCWSERVSAMALTAKTLTTTSFFPPDIQRCFEIARAFMSGQLVDNTGGATHYLTRALYNSPHRPSWANVPVLATRGHHVFFRTA